MIKKAIIIIGIVGLIQLIIIACCSDPNTYYNRITELEFANCNLQNVLDDGETVSKGNHRLRLKITEETFAQLFNPSKLINAAYATSCEDIFAGLKSDIVEFSISCNEEIFDTEAGTSIDYNKLSVYKIGFTDDLDNQRKTIQEWLDIMNNGGYLLAFEWYFAFNEQINSTDFLKFKVNIKQEDGTRFVFETNAIKIE